MRSGLQTLREGGDWIIQVSSTFLWPKSHTPKASREESEVRTELQKREGPTCKDQTEPRGPTGGPAGHQQGARTVCPTSSEVASPLPSPSQGPLQSGPDSGCDTGAEKPAEPSQTSNRQSTKPHICVKTPRVCDNTNTPHSPSFRLNDGREVRVTDGDLLLGQTTRPLGSRGPELWRHRPCALGTLAGTAGDPGWPVCVAAPSPVDSGQDVLASQRVKPHRL